MLVIHVAMLVELHCTRSWQRSAERTEKGFATPTCPWTQRNPLKSAEYHVTSLLNIQQMSRMSLWHCRDQSVFNVHQGNNIYNLHVATRKRRKQKELNNTLQHNTTPTTTRKHNANNQNNTHTWRWRSHDNTMRTYAGPTRGIVMCMRGAVRRGEEFANGRE